MSSDADIWPDAAERKRVSDVYRSLSDASVGLSGRLESFSGHHFANVFRKQVDLQRMSEQSSMRRFLLPQTDDSQAIEVFGVPKQLESLSCESTSPSGEQTIRFRKGDKEEFWLELWTVKHGMLQSLSVGDKLSAVYDSSTFGSIAWSEDEMKCCFIGEVTKSKKFKSYFTPSGEENGKSKSEASDKKEKEDTVWAESEFEYQESFGEKLDKYCQPGVFVYDVKTNVVQLVDVAFPDEKVYPLNAVFDKSAGLVVQGMSLPGKKLGYVFCLNKPTALYHIEGQDLSSYLQEATEKGEMEVDKTKKQVVAKRVTPEGFFLAFNPIFSKDFSTLVFFGSVEPFVSHSATFSMFAIQWPLTGENPVCVGQGRKEYPTSTVEFCGFFGYQFTFPPTQFLGQGNKFVVAQAPVKGCNRIFVVDVESKAVKRLDFLGTDNGEEELVDVKNNLVMFKHCAFNQPPTVHVAKLDAETGQVLRTWCLEGQETRLLSDDSLRSSVVDGVEQHIVSLENGSEGYLQFNRKHLEAGSGKLPCVVIIHGGPFGASSRESFLVGRSIYIALGYAIFVVNYRGSVGYGADFLDSLVGNIGDFDVHDCGHLVQTMLKEHASVVDAARVGVYGGSHGGFLTGWLVGHPEYKALFRCAVLWNPVLNISYNVQATDIPDWCYACGLGKDFSKLGYSAEENDAFFARSPFSVVNNVSCPCLLVIGDGDLRVPPHQAYYYYHTLKANGVRTKMFSYPNCGHAIAPCKENVNATLNIMFWFSKNL